MRCWCTRLLVLVLLLALRAPSPSEAATILESTDSLEVVTTTTAAIDYTASWADHTATTFTPGKSAGQITTATTTPVVAAPAASTQRQLKELTLRNVSATTVNGITIQRDVSATNRTMSGFTLAAGEYMVMDTNGTLNLYTSTGQLKVKEVSGLAGSNGLSFNYSKAGTAFDTIGYHYLFAKDPGFPGGFALQTPGVNGFSTDCSIASQTTDPNGAAQMGSHPLADPTAGSYYLTSLTVGNNLVGKFQLIDLLWYNTGLAVTTTTIQSFTQGTLPARDNNGTSNGAGVRAALYALTALGNAAAVSNTIITYTDQDGNGSATGTFPAVVGWNAPATPVIGTFMPFALAAGDSGIRTIQSITLGTTYTSGTMSLMMFREIANISVNLVNLGHTIEFPTPGIRIYPNSCLALVGIGAPAVTAQIPLANYTIVER